MGDPVTVAIPTRNGGGLLRAVLRAVRRQRVDRDVEVMVADSGSLDGSRELARRYGAIVVDIPPGEFSHGGTRNLLVRCSSGSHVALLTQDAVPADEHWLARLLEGFDVADDVGLVFGRYRARMGASVMVRRELTSGSVRLPLKSVAFPTQTTPMVRAGCSLPTRTGVSRERPGKRSRSRRSRTPRISGSHATCLPPGTPRSIALTPQ